MKKGKSILALVLCIPLAFIAFFAIKYSSQTVSDVVSVSIETPDKSTAEFETKEDVDFFVGILNSATQIGGPIRDISEEKPVDIIYSRSDKQIEYKLYPSLNLSGCMMEGPIGTESEQRFYNVRTEDAKSLLLREEFSYLYSALFLPEFKVVSGTNEYTVAPKSCEWHYLKSDGITYEYTPENIATGEEIYMIIKGLDNEMRFASAEEGERAKISNLSFVTESGMPFSIENISQLDLSTDTLIKVCFTASWDSFGGAQSYGTAEYEFSVLYDIPAVIELDEIEHKTGDAVVITATHLNVREQAKIESSLYDGEKGFFVTENDNGVAIIPIPYTTKPQAYTLDIFNGASTQKESFNVKRFENTSDTLMISVTAEEHETYLSEKGMAEFEAKTKEITTKEREDSYFVFGKDKFSLPLGSKKKPDHTFGQAVMLGVADGSTDLGARDVLGEIYLADKGTKVRSSQAGIVVFCGEFDPTGQTVIIYHGYGIYTHYYHLDEIDVSEGQVVKAGEEIGKLGDSGFTFGKSALQYGVSVGEYFINPEQMRQ